QRPERRRRLALAAGELLVAGDGLDRRGLDPVELALALLLAGDGQRLRQLGGDRLLDQRVHVVAVVDERRILRDRLGGRRGQLRLGPAQLPDERLGRLKALRDDLLGRRGGAAGYQ